ncbi:aminopeptidase-like protein [Trypanosoma rangeli]|uniref:Aminopeptidase n=1 Tax=Trypanosoma rangeli TaxID=5698 RepID=A0A3R7K1R9_TRYRA|nr:aminopeptidase-like protein [Trypanosoma rangeli]RNE99040.1 aminopeptidase-like protein [Trypanosoma rangeli]|eukprot:RNE99040.1 aminopeptidase-like protein [Trypanosoma rangeli]
MTQVRNILPDDPTPHHYKITILPDLDAFLFTGHVDIQLTAKRTQKSITLHCNELSLVKVTLTSAGNPSAVETIPAESILLDASEMKATFLLQTPFIGEAVLSIDYTGEINDRLAGFYRSKYTVKGKECYMGSTQFEPVDARRAIPCWDEPAVKAVFEMIITAPSNLLVLSNMPHRHKEKVGDKIRWTFYPTPKMSTYLLAWAIGEFEYVERRIKKTHGVENGQPEDTLVRVFTPEGKTPKASFALDVACQVLPLYEEFFESNYILPKADLLAIPDFAAGAMENWGLITYRETALLCDENSSAFQRQYVAIVVAHELAHQWFGNLVTMQWWKELWLNESFATYMEYWSINKLFPDWHVFTQFVHQENSRALKLDSLRSSHPVEVDVQNAKEIDDIFDAISYSKGGSIVRMVVNFIGEAAFQKGMTAYLKHFAYGNATTEDLWNFLGKAAGKALVPILKSWTGKQGYPFLTVASSPDKQTLQIIQHRFFATGDTCEKEDETVWKIPLMLTTPEHGIQRYVLEERKNSLTSPHPSWVKVNSDLSAFCRVLYESEDLLQSLLSAVAAKKLSNIDRLGIISDYHAFARAGYCGAVKVLQLLSYYVDEDDFTVWCCIIDFETELKAVVATQGEKALNAHNTFFRKLYSNAMKKVGYTFKSDDDHNVIQLRASLFTRLVADEDEETIAYALNLYAERQTTPINSDLRCAVVSAFLKRNGRAALDEVKMLAETALDAMERTHYLRAMASSKVDGLVTELFEYAFYGKIRSQDIVYILGPLAANTETFEAYASELRRMWSLLVKKLPGLILGDAVKFIEHGANKNVANDMEAFWNKLDEGDKQGMLRSFQQGLEGIRNNAVWASRDAKEVAEFYFKAYR